MEDPRVTRLYLAAIQGRIGRRALIRRAAALGLSGPIVASLLAACGGSSASPTTSTAATSTSSTSPGGTSGTPGASGAASPTAASVGGGTAKQGGSIIIGTLGEASGINPIIASQSEDLFRCQQLFGQLVAIDPATLKPVPDLASSWDISNLTFTFHLQPNAKFSDGSDMTADDIAFTMKAILAKATASPNQTRLVSIQGAKEYTAGTATDVPGIKIVDPKTLAVTLTNADSSFLLNMRYVMPVPGKQLQGKNLGKGSTDPYFQHPIGAGPFQYVSWNVGGDFVAKRNPHYYAAPKPYLDQFTHRVIADSVSLVNALLSGGIDGSIYADPSGTAKLKADGNLKVLVPPFGPPDGWQFNFKNAYLAKKEVRQAVAYALDMTQFAKDSLYGLGGPGTGPIAPGSYAYDKSLKPWPYDLEKAKSLLQQAGTPPSGITFVSNQGNVLRQDFLTYTQAQLSKIGWNITPQLIEYATLVDRIINKTYDVAESEEVGSGANIDPGELFNIYSTGGSENTTGYSNPQLDTLLKQAKEELDLTKQVPLYAQIQQILYNDLPATYSWYRPFIHVVASKFAGYTVTGALPEGVFADLANFYVKS
ncbi:MAG TPA: ABC transporter substrate-binding protein [Thermomicrobiaceae bacterium]|nr:ABC transporter substrate-binding protein [Thermomicrobiaceae bacterium]